MDGSGTVNKESLANLFKSESVYKDKEDTSNGVSKSLQSLRTEFGGPDNLFEQIRTDVIRGIDGSQAELTRRRQEHGENKRHVREV